MKRLVWLVCLAALAAPDRAALQTVEKMVDRRIETMFDDPFLLLGMTRGVYVEGVGVVLSAEVGLAVTAAGPFSPRPSKEDMARLRQKRLDRLPVLRASMQEILQRTAVMLETVPAQENVVLGVTIFRKSNEDNTGLPGQIVMRAKRQDLLDKKTAQVSEF
ncbi:MAG: hypothetical protein NTZ56_21590 [Acidobacteria bacterium]|nr:hypothetical protein [Acidobacteriota bacterium]